MAAGRPKKDIDILPNGWYNGVLELYLEGASDVEIKAYIYNLIGSFSNDLWDRWIKEEVEFSETIKRGIVLRGNKIKVFKCKSHQEKLRTRRKIRASEYKGDNKIVMSLRSMLYYHTKNIHGKFNKKTFDLLAYNKEEYINNIKSKFLKGMSFDNYGDWHIDHKKPVSLFDLSKESEVRKCWDLDNLQPLWAFDNLSKSNKYAST